MFKTGAQVAWFKDPDGNILSLTQFSNERAGRSPRVMVTRGRR
jgi:hypothetical protein